MFDNDMSSNVNTSQENGNSSSSSPISNNRSKLVSVIILFVINLLNYMDRLTIAGILPNVKKYYKIDDSQAGLLQTSFVCSYMILAPIFGYLGDRYNKKIIMAVGIIFWSCMTFLSSFVPAEYFWWFLLCRGLVGVGEASYSTIAPTVIADMYIGSMRSKMLALFYFAIPVGSGLGYVVGANVAKFTGSWQDALWVSPPLGFICVVLLLKILQIPPRGESEGGEHLSTSSWKEDLISLSKNRSFVFSSLGFTAVAFVAGALSWWGPTFLYRAELLQNGNNDLSTISLIFGVITMSAGFIGITIGSSSAYYLKKTDMTADATICAFGLIFSMPFIFFGIVASEHNNIVAYILIFIGEVLLCLNWALVADILLYVVIPTRRSTAEAFQILLSHAFGDAGSPYIIGILSDSIAKGKAPTKTVNFVSLQYAAFTTCFVSVLGGLCFIICSWYIIDDKKKVDETIRDAGKNSDVTLSSPCQTTTGNENEERY